MQWLTGVDEQHTWRDLHLEPADAEAGRDTRQPDLGWGLAVLVLARFAAD